MNHGEAWRRTLRRDPCNVLVENVVERRVEKKEKKHAALAVIKSRGIK